jgi:hypothetical protein
MSAFTHGNQIIPPVEKRICLELVYCAGQTNDSSMRGVATRLETRIGGAIGRKFLLEMAGKLPDGLSNENGKMTLRRAVNDLLGMNKLMTSENGRKVAITRRDYTNEELMDAF